MYCIIYNKYIEYKIQIHTQRKKTKMKCTIILTVVNCVWSNYGSYIFWPIFSFKICEINLYYCSIVKKENSLEEWSLYFEGCYVGRKEIRMKNEIESYLLGHLLGHLDPIIQRFLAGEETNLELWGCIYHSNVLSDLSYNFEKLLVIFVILSVNGKILCTISLLGNSKKGVEIFVTV